jgi:hypothetical protein
MPPSDSARGQGPADLIRDIGKSSTLTPQTNLQEQQLMRVARDPLAIRDILLQGDIAVEEPNVVTLLPGEAAIALAHRIVVEGDGGRLNWRLGDMHYIRHEARWQTAAQASAFAPSREDRDEALDLNSSGAERAGPSRFAFLRLTALCVLAILLFVMLRLIDS